MATFNVNAVAIYDHTYQTYTLYTEVSRLSPSSDKWVLGEIQAINTVSHDDGLIGIQTTYTIEYSDGDCEDLSHDEVTERIRLCQLGSTSTHPSHDEVTAER